MSRTCLFIALAVGATACDFPYPVITDARTVDAQATPDAVTSCVANTTTCDDATSTYVDCGSDGTPISSMHCPLGCAQGMAKCVDVAASNGLSGYLDQAGSDAAVVDVTFTGSSTINTDTGAVTDAGVATTIPTAVSNGIRVLMFKNLQIPGTLKVTGTLPVALIAYGSVSITGTLDVSADANTNGPGAVTSGACVGGSQVNAMPYPGGGGGGRFTAGANGGNGYGPITGLMGGAAMSDPDLQPLLGGCQGGNVGILMTPPPPPSSGGGGGGALQITCRGVISMTGGGVIDASGGGGLAGPEGGGSGGAVLIEAPQLVLDGVGVVVSTKGGGGGGETCSGLPYPPGRDGGTDAIPAPGGHVNGCTVDGGVGGTETGSPTVGGNSLSMTYKGAGGGGGSVGEARFNDADASILPANGAAIRSHYSVSSIGTRFTP